MLDSTEGSVDTENFINTIDKTPYQVLDTNFDEQLKATMFYGQSGQIVQLNEILTKLLCTFDLMPSNYVEIYKQSIIIPISNDIVNTYIDNKGYSNEL